MTTKRILQLAKKQKKTLPFTSKQLDELSANGKWAIAYALIGLWVFRLVPGTKIPFKGSHGFYDATIDLVVIFEWWSNEPYANIGIRTGKETGIFALDFDIRSGGEDSCVELIDANGEFPETPFNLTPGGFHLLFVYPDDGRIIKSLSGKNAPMPGMDVKSDRGYIVVPPSSREDAAMDYEWNEYENPFDTDFAAAPEWVLGIVTVQENEGSRTSKTSADWSQYAEPACEGSRHDTLTTIGGLYFRVLDPDIAYPSLHAWNEAYCEPPLPDHEVDGIADWIAGKELDRRKEWRSK
jgi:hypothetical protein